MKALRRLARDGRPSVERFLGAVESQATRSSQPAPLLGELASLLGVGNGWMTRSSIAHILCLEFLCDRCDSYASQIDMLVCFHVYMSFTDARLSLLYCMVEYIVAASYLPF